MSLTRTCRRTTTMPRSLARSSSVSLVLPFAPQNQSLVYTLRRAQSSIPAIECPRGSPTDPLKGNSCHLQQSTSSSRDFEQDSYRSNYSSCDSSLADYLEFSVVEEPQRVSKDVLRSLSTSFRWLDIPFADECELPSNSVDAASMGSYFEPLSEMSNSVESTMGNYFESVSGCSKVGNGLSSSGKSMTKSFKWLEVPFHESELPSSNVDDDRASLGASVRMNVDPPVGRSVKRVIMSHLYMHDCRTGKSVMNHMEVKEAMDSLGHWTMLAPRNCCLSYKHDSSGEVATLPWPDIDAGGPDEIEEFVRLVNRVEERIVFYPRYGR